MEFRSIFRAEEKANLYAVCYPEDNIGNESQDIFSLIFDMFNNTEYLLEFLVKNAAQLQDPFWDGITEDQALDKIRQESSHFDYELYCIENKKPGYEHKSLQDVFKPLHHNITSIRFDKEQQRKGKPDFSKPMIRLYGLELEDGTIVITGGAIKLTKKMEGKFFDKQKANLIRVQEYLKQEGITTKEGLL